MVAPLICEVRLGSSDYEQALALRREVLLEPFGIPLQKACVDDAQAIHLALLEAGRVVGCLLLIDRGSTQWQLRQMAVAPERQGHGIGRRLVEAAWERAREAGCTRLWAHARESAVPFYLRVGLSVEGEPFWEVGLPHRLVARTVAGSSEVHSR